MLRKEVAKDGREGVRGGELLLAYGYSRPVQTINVRRITSIAALTNGDRAPILGEKVSDAPNTTH
jgi:hypothetical protein